jgi:hypothetical protein
MDSSNGVAGIIGFFLTFYLLFIIAFYVLNGLAFMNLAKIAGRSDIAWMAWVPICNVIQQLLLIKKSGWNILWYLVPIAKMGRMYYSTYSYLLFTLFFGLFGAFQRKPNIHYRQGQNLIRYQHNRMLLKHPKFF